MIEKNAPASASTDFRSLALPTSLQDVVTELGYQQLTPIQAQSIPLLLEGRDVIGQSKTGSGKTAAFTLPILAKLNLNGRRLQALVLCPTRELCTQVAREVRKLGRRESGLQVLVLSGGLPLRPQQYALENGVHVVVGTPGRVLDHLGRGVLDLRDLCTVVLDEADRMLDMGFQEDMEKILGSAPKKRQTVFFSATFPRSIEAMSEAFQRQPVRVTIDESDQTTPAIRQQIYYSEPEEKLGLLRLLLQEHQPDAALVFCNHKATVASLTEALAGGGVSTGCLHGDLEQHERDRVMAKFRNHSVRVLVATDVAARGLDVADLDVVFNFDLPSKADTYVHRIGRTGRAGNKGLAISLANRREAPKVKRIEEFMGREFERQRLPAAVRPDAVAAAVPSLKRHGMAMETLYISGGRKEKLRPGDILGALTGEAGGLSAAEIGKIEIHDHFAYVAIAKSTAPVALEKLRDGRIKGRKFQIEMVR